MGPVHGQSQRGQRPHQNALWVRTPLSSEIYKTQLWSLVEFPQEHRKATLSGTDMQTRDDAGTVLSASNGNTWGVPVGLCSDDCLSEWQVCPWPLTVQESPLPSSHQAADNPASRTPERQGWGDDREDRLSHQGNTSLQGPCPDGSISRPALGTGLQPPRSSAAAWQFHPQELHSVT